MEGTIETKNIDRSKRVKRIIGITVNVLIYVFFALCLCLLIFAISSKRSVDGATEMFGREMRIVLTGSMEKSDKDVSGYKIKSIPIHSMVFVEKIPQDEAEAEEWYASLEVGDVLNISYVYAQRLNITHRLVEKQKLPEGGYYLKLEGDNKNDNPAQGTQEIYTSEDHPLHQIGNYVIGKVTGQSKLLGKAVYNVKQPLGISLIIIIPSALIIIMESIHIGSIVSSRKKEKIMAENQKQTDEIEELKRKLAVLEGGATAQEAAENQASPDSTAGQPQSPDNQNNK